MTKSAVARNTPAAIFVAFSNSGRREFGTRVPRRMHQWEDFYQEIDIFDLLYSRNRSSRAGISKDEVGTTDSQILLTLEDWSS